MASISCSYCGAALTAMTQCVCRPVEVDAVIVREGCASDSDIDIELLRESGLNQRHFNTLQSEYRKLASGWLLAAFSAIGYVQIHFGEKAIQNEFLGSIAMGSFVGIAVLWVLDQLVYQRLLQGSFDAATDIEKKLLKQELGPNSKMREQMRQGSVGAATNAFYLALAFAAPVCVFFVVSDVGYRWLALLINACCPFS